MPSEAAVATSPEAFLQLVADPHRWHLLRELSLSDRRVGELTERLDKPQNLVSYHLGALKKAGLVSSRRSSFDARDTYYRVDARRCGEMLCSSGRALFPGLQLDVGTAEPTEIEGTPPRVLFLCTGNSARSQMAEALLEERSDHRIEAFSAGSHPKDLHPNAVRVMAERGIDIADHKPKNLTRFSRSRFDRVITLCDKVREVCPGFAGDPTTAHWSMPDPSAEESYEAFVRTADELEERIEGLITQIAEEGQRRRQS